MPSSLTLLAASLREATSAIAARDLERLQGAVRAQQQALALLATGQDVAIRELRDSPEVAADLARSSAVLSRVLRRAARTDRVLASLYLDSGEPYSPESLRWR